jgi:hypothetical protein
VKNVISRRIGLLLFGQRKQARFAAFLQPVTLPANVDGGRMVQQAVEDRGRDDRVNRSRKSTFFALNAPSGRRLRYSMQSSIQARCRPALDIQASALVRQSPAKVQQRAEQIKEQFLFMVLTDEDLKRAISKQTGGSAATAHRWTKFRAAIQPVLDGTRARQVFCVNGHSLCNGSSLVD